MTLKINTIDYRGSIVDGPGIRTVIFVQGCNRHCKGCHNPSTWDITKGKPYEINTLVAELKQKCHNKKITISGGEPLLQYDEILKLVKELPDFNIALYTGFELEEVPKEILQYLNYIKVRPFILEQRTTTKPYVGSKNQQFIILEEK